MMQIQHNLMEAIAFQTAKEGKDYCGDSFFMTVKNDIFLCILADGLGSGKAAFEASSSVVDFVKEHLELDVETLIQECNKLLVNKRGAAVSIMKIDLRKREFIYSCVGNIRFFLYTPSGKTTYPLPVTGYLSGRPQIYRTHRFSYETNSRFLLHSDGLKLSNSKTFIQSGRPLEAIANEIERDHIRKTDDSTFILGSLL
ncbi:phosphoserine phosphatase [Heyndrickxia shackletonii]|uniref:Phosphoserine phosphatase n=1 Tax=Heyndrickxia shackletonii TaxID=157838 RepID=A0A0Q3WT64_9BACI|nr:PP2C family serine/threonine-protein phosphatase [Heyndrickxia shackletonii]KQL51039.1 phosphoserine phosphatase [Heyndrickxia shackletonii]MBB2483479.1 SpoIIE family protein phosphatase [Bacillus sp. APMAM]NEZ00745.1 SpoIIE family protein phosphatase [Heyndrickxia shackletonii]RTZ53104.1 phosphoserine phosphatase [Bacillus sp. SAJ1]